MAEFWFHVFRNWADYFPLLPALLWFGAGVIFVVLAGAWGLFRRNWLIHRVLTGLYYVYIPLVFFLISLLHYWVNDLEKAMFLALDQSRQSISATATNNAQQALAPFMKVNASHTLFDVQAIGAAFASTLTEQYSVPVPLEKVMVADVVEIDIPTYFRDISQDIQHLFAAQMAAAMQERLAKTLDGSSQVSPKEVLDFWNNSFKAELEQGLAVETAQTVLQELFVSIRQHLYPLWVLLVAPPMVETLLFFLFRRKPREPFIK